MDVTLSQGVYDPDGLAFDATGNVWVVNQTDATGTGPGSVVKFAGSSLGGSSSPEVTLSLPTRYTIGVAIHRP